MNDHLAPAERIVSDLEAFVADATAALVGLRGGGDEPVNAWIDRNQAVAYDLAAISGEVAAARALVDGATAGSGGEVAATMALVRAAEVGVDVRARVDGRHAAFGIDPLPPGRAPGVDGALAAGRDPRLLEALAEEVIAAPEAGRPRLSEELEMVRQSFRRFGQEHVVPVAQQVHRTDTDVPAAIVEGLAELGCFGLTIPSEHGGLATGGAGDLASMVLVTEELSRASLGIAGSLITRPEIIATAILHGGTPAQRERWLPAIASGSCLCGVAVTEPDHGSDVAAITTTAVRDGEDWVLDGVKTWSTFAGRAHLLLVLARTDADRSTGHRGLSLFVLEKPSFEGHTFEVVQEGGGRMQGSAIPTIGYRGMHSFEVSIEGWRVPHADLIGEDDGVGRGFVLQMQAFANARLQTAGRAQGVMQAALDEAVAHVRGRRVFGVALADLQLTRVKLARAAAALAACRAFSARVAAGMAGGGSAAALGAAQAKQVACHAAEWVTREAQQLHGGYGYAEEYVVSRLFVDARVLSIFEGADEVLALKVIARQLLEQADPSVP